MLSDELKESLVEYSSEGTTLNFERLISFLEESEVSFVKGKFRVPVGGLTTPEHVYIAIDNLMMMREEMVYFVFLHELCHGLRFIKMGKDYHMDSLSHEEFGDFADYILYEEILADRYGSLIYKIFNGVSLDKKYTQQLDIQSNAIRYKTVMGNMYGVVKGDEDNYKELVNTYMY